MKTLLINPGKEDEAWGLLDELAGLYGDNGGDPDGNAWLPSMHITEDEAEPVLEAGAGEMIHALGWRETIGRRSETPWTITPSYGRIMGPTALGMRFG